MRRLATGLAAALMVAAAAASWAVLPLATPATLRDVPSREPPVGQAPPGSEFWLEPGYRLELVAGGLTYPTAMAFGPRGEIWIAEAGYAPGGATAVPRIVRVLRGGALQEVCRLPDGPVTGLVHREGFLYAIGGRGPAELWRYKLSTNQLDTLLTGLPAWGRHNTSELAFDAAGRMYFAVGAASNSGVMGPEDGHTYGVLGIFPEARDVPAIRVKVAGRAFASSLGGVAVETGAFQPYGQAGGAAGTVIQPGTPPAVTGAIMRANADGSGLELVASGFRNVVGLGFAPDGRLLAVNLAMEDRGIRPVAGDVDALWVVTFGGWYGFPDFAAGQLVDVSPLLAEHPALPEGPHVRFAAPAGTHGFAFATDERFGHTGQMFVAQFGAHFGETPQGHRILRVDMETREAREFYVNLVPGPSGSAPERPTAVRFGPDGCLYVVDYGRLAAAAGRLYPSALTGALWRISPRRPLIAGGM
jgi:glucose/arabinose dehydrogenase